MKADNAAAMKRRNRTLFLKLLCAEPLSRAELARRTGLSKAAVSLIVDELLELGIVTETGTVDAGLGRRPTMLYLTPDAGCVIGLDLSRNGCHAGITDLSGTLLWEKSWDEVFSDPDTALAAYTGAIRAAVPPLRRTVTVISAPGPLDSEHGVLLSSPGFSLWHRYPIAEKAAEILNCPVFLEKDTNLLAAGEKNGKDNFLFLLADHGLGAALVQNGKSFCGYHGFGCELGHVTLDPAGPLCHCGNVGCAEMLVSVPAVLEKAQKRGLNVSSWQALTSLADEGDASARSLLCEHAALLGTVCVTAVNLLEPECIVLGGEMACGGAYFTDRLSCEINGRTMTRREHEIGVVPSSQKGAARLRAALQSGIQHWIEEGDWE